MFYILTMNIGRGDKKGIHWWSLLELHNKQKSFHLIVLVFSRLKEFLIGKNDRNIIHKIEEEIIKLV